MKLILSLILSCGTLAFAGEPSSPYVPVSPESEIDYQVPVNDPELLPYAKFTITSFSRTVLDNGQVEMKYTLPAELIGHPFEVSFRSVVPNAVEFNGLDTEVPVISAPQVDVANAMLFKDEVTVFQGNNGDMKCLNGACQVKYRGVTIDAKARNELLKEISLSSKELTLRQQVASIFGTDPGGVFRYPYVEEGEE